MGKITLVAVALLALAGCGDDTPEPLGDAHVIEVARQSEVNDGRSDADILDFAATKCPVLDPYGEEGFDRIASNIVAIVEDADQVRADFQMIGAAVRAYCPEHIPAMQEWLDDVTGSMASRVYECGSTITGLCWAEE